MSAVAKDLRENLLKYFIFAGFGLSGTAALIYEVIWTRSLSTVMGSTTYALSTMLAAFMAGLSFGGLLGGRYADRFKRPEIVFAACELGIGLTGLITIPLIKSLTPLYVKAFYYYHLSFSAFSTVQFIIIFLIMAVPTTLMGLAFPVVIKYFTKDRETVGRQSGFLYFVNTFGAIIGSVSSGFILIPVLGISGAAYTAASLNIITGLGVLALSRESRKLFLSFVSIPVFMVASAALEEPDIPIFSYYSAFRFDSYKDVMAKIEEIKSSGENMFVYHREGIEGNVYLTRHKTLINNGKWEAGDDIGFSLLAFLPYLSYTGDKVPKVLNIGLGSGDTLSSLSLFPHEHIDSVELNPDVMEINRKFLRPELFTNPLIRHIQADGRNFLMLSDMPYEIITVSPSWAVESSSSEFLTDEFFSLARRKLAPGGIIAVWVDYFLMEDKDLEIVLRTFGRHFKYVRDWHIDGDNMILIGSMSPFKLNDLETVEAAVSFKPALRDSFRSVMNEDTIASLPEGDINTDNRPLIEFHNAKNIILGPKKISRFHRFQKG